MRSLWADNAISHRDGEVGASSANVTGASNVSLLAIGRVVRRPIRPNRIFDSPLGEISRAIRSPAPGWASLIVTRTSLNQVPAAAPDTLNVTFFATPQVSVPVPFGMLPRLPGSESFAGGSGLV